MKRLNLGCGPDYRKGWVNVDIRKDIKADIVHNLNKFPYPFKEDEFDITLISHTLEHLDYPERVLKEVVKICKSGAKLIVEVPHAFSYANATDMQHRRNFTENSFTRKHIMQYGLGALRLRKKVFLYPVNKWKKYIPLKRVLKIFFNGIYDNLLFEFKIGKEK